MKAIIYRNKISEVVHDDIDTSLIKNVVPVVPGFPDCDQAYYYISHAEYAYDKAEGKAYERWVYKPHDLTHCLMMKRGQLAAYRHTKENEEVTISGIKFIPNEKTLSAFMQANAIASSNAGYIIDWKGIDGWITMDATTIINTFYYLHRYVQECFSTERIHYNYLGALTDPIAVIEYNFTIGWPILRT